MRIADVSWRLISSHRFLLVRIVTDDGVVGYGEGSGLTGAVQWLERFKPILTGEDPFDIQRLATQLLWGKQEGEFITYGDELADPVAAWLIRYGAAGASLDHAATRAVAAIEMALVDVVGKALGTPAYNLLGGKFRSRVPVYLDLAGVKDMSTKSWRAYGTWARTLGFKAVKCDVDMLAPELHRDPWDRSISRPELRKTVELLSALRDGLGSDIELAADCHGQYNVPDAERLARALEPVGLLWLEDPIPDFNPAALASIRAATSTPIATGELFQTLLEHREYIDARAVDVLHPDTRMVGGPLEHKRVADYADAHFIPTAAHNGASPFGTIASAHVCAASRSFLYLEFHWYGVEWINDLVAGGMPLVDGCIELSGAPGYGTTINEAAWDARSGKS